MQETSCELRGKLYDERFERDKTRIEHLEDLTAKVSECYIQQSEIIKNHNEKLKDHEQRLDNIENRPGNLWDKVISGVISAVVAAIMAIILK